MTKSEIQYKPDFLTKCLGVIQRQHVHKNSQLFEEPGNLIGFTYVTELKQGASFGEKGLDDGTPRTATILCSSDCEFACLLKADYDKLLKEVNKEKMEKINDFFYSIVFKNSITRALINSIGGDFSKNVLRLTKGKYLFSQGSLDSNVYVIKSGMILIEYMVETEDRFLGNPVGGLKVVKVLHGIYKVLEGEILGEECLFDDLPKKVSAKVISNDAELLWTTKQTLRNYVVHSTILEDFFKSLVKVKSELRDNRIKKLCGEETANSNDNRSKIQGVGLNNLLQVLDQSIGIKTKKSPVFYLPKTQKYKEAKASNFDEIQRLHYNPQAEFMRREYPQRGGKFPLLKDCEEVLLSSIGDKECVPGQKQSSELALMDSQIFVRNHKLTQDLWNSRRNLIKQRGYGRVEKKQQDIASQTGDEKSRMWSLTRRANSEVLDDRKPGDGGFGVRPRTIYHNSSALSCQDFVRGDMLVPTPKKVLLSFDGDDYDNRATGKRGANKDGPLFVYNARSVSPQAIRPSPFQRNTKTTRCLESTEESTFDVPNKALRKLLFPKISDCLRSKKLEKTLEFINKKREVYGRNSQTDLLMLVKSANTTTETSEVHSLELEEVAKRDKPNLSRLKASSIMLMTPESSSYKP